MEVPKIPALNISNKALTEMRRNSVAMENYTKAIKSKAGQELSAVIDQYNEVLAIANTIEAADKYAAETRKRAKEEAGEEMYGVNKAVEMAQDRYNKQNKLLDERSAKLTTDIAANDARKKDLDARAKTLVEDENQVRIDAAENKTEAAKIMEDGMALDTRATTITKDRADLDAWRARMNAASAPA